ncbi:hypothetical protein GCM10020331_036720 [Ectobacillus funiculus]
MYLSGKLQIWPRKRAIAYEAAKHITSGERIILDASTTAWYLAKALPDMPLTVITNSIKVAVELSKKRKKFKSFQQEACCFRNPYLMPDL